MRKMVTQTPKTNKAKLPLATRQGILLYIRDYRVEYTFKQYCDADTTLFGYIGSLLRQRCVQFHQDIKRRYIEGKKKDKTQKWKNLLKDHCLGATQLEDDVEHPNPFISDPPGAALPRSPPRTPQPSPTSTAKKQTSTKKQTMPPNTRKKKAPVHFEDLDKDFEDFEDFNEDVRDDVGFDGRDEPSGAKTYFPMDEKKECKYKSYKTMMRWNTVIPVLIRLCLFLLSLSSVDGGVYLFDKKAMENHGGILVHEFEGLVRNSHKHNGVRFEIGNVHPLDIDHYKAYFQQGSDNYNVVLEGPKLAYTDRVQFKEKMEFQKNHSRVYDDVFYHGKSEHLHRINNTKDDPNPTVPKKKTLIKFNKKLSNQCKALGEPNDEYHIPRDYAPTPTTFEHEVQLPGGRIDRIKYHFDTATVAFNVTYAKEMNRQVEVEKKQTAVDEITQMMTGTHVHTKSTAHDAAAVEAERQKLKKEAELHRRKLEAEAHRKAEMERLRLDEERRRLEREAEDERRRLAEEAEQNANRLEQAKQQLLREQEEHRRKLAQAEEQMRQTKDAGNRSFQEVLAKQEANRAAEENIHRQAQQQEAEKAQLMELKKQLEADAQQLQQQHVQAMEQFQKEVANDNSRRTRHQQAAAQEAEQKLRQELAQKLEEEKQLLQQKYEHAVQEVQQHAMQEAARATEENRRQMQEQFAKEKAMGEEELRQQKVAGFSQVARSEGNRVLNLVESHGPSRPIEVETVTNNFVFSSDEEDDDEDLMDDDEAFMEALNAAAIEQGL